MKGISFQMWIPKHCIFTILLRPHGKIETRGLDFFDTDKDSYIDHVVIFDQIDENGIWIWDATTDPDGIEINAVSHKILRSMWKKNPYFAIPLKVVFRKHSRFRYLLRAYSP